MDAVSEAACRHTLLMCEAAVPTSGRPSPQLNRRNTPGAGAGVAACGQSLSSELRGQSDLGTAEGLGREAHGGGRSGAPFTLPLSGGLSGGEHSQGPGPGLIFQILVRTP